MLVARDCSFIHLCHPRVLAKELPHSNTRFGLSTPINEAGDIYDFLSNRKLWHRTQKGVGVSLLVMQDTPARYSGDSYSQICCVLNLGTKQLNSYAGGTLLYIKQLSWARVDCSFSGNGQRYRCFADTNLSVALPHSLPPNGRYGNLKTTSNLIGKIRMFTCRTTYKTTSGAIFCGDNVYDSQARSAEDGAKLRWRRALSMYTSDSWQVMPGTSINSLSLDSIT